MINKINIQGDKMFTISKDAKVNSMPFTENNVNYIKSQNKIEHYQNFINKNEMLQQECAHHERLNTKKKWISRLVGMISSVVFLALIIGFAPLTPIVSNIALVSWAVLTSISFFASHHYCKLQKDNFDEYSIMEEVNIELQKRIAKEKRNLNYYSLDFRKDKKELKTKEEKKRYEDNINYQLKAQYQQLRRELIDLCQEMEQEYYQEEAKVYHL